jgi:hypothetical protein
MLICPLFLKKRLNILFLKFLRILISIFNYSNLEIKRLKIPRIFFISISIINILVPFLFPL